MSDSLSSSHTPPPPSRVFSSLLSSHSLSGRAICEGPVQHNSAPAEASSSSGYNSEWISTSSGCLKRMRNCVLAIHPPALMAPLAGMASSTALLGWRSSHMLSDCVAGVSRTQVFGFATENYYVIQISASTLSVRNSLNSRMYVGLSYLVWGWGWGLVFVWFVFLPS